MNLNEHGAACRCLLRLRENQGEPPMSDATFIKRFLPRYPAWRDCPGATDTAAVVDLAGQLHLASRGETFHYYDRVLAEHRAGRGILLETRCAPEQTETPSRARRHIVLLVAMNDDQFTMWCPYPSGLSDTLPAAPRTWWDRWQTSGLVLFPVTQVPLFT